MDELRSEGGLRSSVNVGCPDRADLVLGAPVFAWVFTLNWIGGTDIITDWGLLPSRLK